MRKSRIRWISMASIRVYNIVMFRVPASRIITMTTRTQL